MNFPSPRGALAFLRTHGLKSTLREARRFIEPRTLRGLPEIRRAVAQKVGLEVGGPSDIFTDAGLIPVYREAARVDGFNFACQTMWEGRIAPGETYRPHPDRGAGTQHIGEARDLNEIPPATYDFLLSSHCLEHVANPLLALRNWARVIKPGGALVLVVPDPARTFDRRRPLTSFEHLRQDFDRAVTEADDTHIPEILRLHDFALDPGVSGPAEFEQRARDNLNIRGLHHHAFSPRVVDQALRWAGFNVAFTQVRSPLHIISLAYKPGA